MLPYVSVRVWVWVRCLHVSSLPAAAVIVLCIECCVYCFCCMQMEIHTSYIPTRAKRERTACVWEKESAHAAQSVVYAFRYVLQMYAAYSVKLKAKLKLKLKENMLLSLSSSHWRCDTRCAMRFQFQFRHKNLRDIVSNPTKPTYI